MMRASLARNHLVAITVVVVVAVDIVPWCLDGCVRNFKYCSPKKCLS